MVSEPKSGVAACKYHPAAFTPLDFNFPGHLRWINHAIRHGLSALSRQQPSLAKPLAYGKPHRRYRTRFPARSSTALSHHMARSLPGGTQTNTRTIWIIWFADNWKIEPIYASTTWELSICARALFQRLQRWSWRSLRTPGLSRFPHGKSLLMPLRLLVRPKSIAMFPENLSEPNGGLTGFDPDSMRCKVKKTRCCSFPQATG